MLYRIRNPDIRKIALVPRPANGNTWHLFKQAPELGQIIKADRDDWKVAYVVVAEPGKVEAGGIGPDGQVVKGDDGQPIMDVWDAQTIREAAHSFARNGGLTVDAHFTDGQTLGRWAESYIAPVDHQIEGRPIREGSWVLAIEPTAEGRQAIQDGRIGGVSVEGPASRETVAKEDDGCGCEDTDPLPDELVDALTVALAKAALSTGQRKNLSRPDFAIPPDRYPIQDRAHAINALARVAQNGSPAEQAQVRRAVCRRYPDLPACKNSVAKARPTPADPDGDGDVDLPSPKARAMYRRLRAKGMSVKQALALTQKALGIRDSDDMAKASGHAPYAALHAPIRHHGKQNWVDKVGGLPGPIDAIARVLISKGWDEQRAVATAVSTAKTQCATGRAFGGKVKLGGPARAVICKAVAEWEAKKAAA